MDPKGIPSDSLYKFASIFCLALLLACVYAFVSVINQYGVAREKLNEKMIAIDYEAALKGDMTSQNRKLRETYSNMINGHRQDAGFYLSFILAGLVGSIVGALWGFRRWMLNLQQYVDLQVQLETERLRRQVEGPGGAGA